MPTAQPTHIRRPGLVCWYGSEAGTHTQHFSLLWCRPGQDVTRPGFGFRCVHSPLVTVTHCGSQYSVQQSVSCCFVLKPRVFQALLGQQPELTKCMMKEGGARRWWGGEKEFSMLGIERFESFGAWKIWQGSCCERNDGALGPWAQRGRQNMVLRPRDWALTRKSWCGGVVAPLQSV